MIRCLSRTKEEAQEPVGKRSAYGSDPRGGWDTCLCSEE